MRRNSWAPRGPSARTTRMRRDQKTPMRRPQVDDVDRYATGCASSGRQSGMLDVHGLLKKQHDIGSERTTIEAAASCLLYLPGYPMLSTLEASFGSVSR